MRWVVLVGTMFFCFIGDCQWRLCVDVGLIWVGLVLVCCVCIGNLCACTLSNHLFSLSHVWSVNL